MSDVYVRVMLTLVTILLTVLCALQGFNIFVSIATWSEIDDVNIFIEDHYGSSR